MTRSPVPRPWSRLCTVLAAAVLACAAMPCAAQDAAGAGLEREERGVLMSERAFRRFDAMVALYGEARYAEAMAAADSYLGSDLNDYERAMGEQIVGFVLIALDRLADAVGRFEQAIELDALPNQAHFSMMRSLAQLYASLEQWRASIDMMALYLAYQPEATAEDRIMMGQNHAQLGQHRDALSWVRGAIEQAGAESPESWHQLELSIHLELGGHRAALGVLETLVARWPDRLRYWEMMAGTHQELGEDADALAALMAAYNGGLITTEAKLLNLARMSLYVELPYQAGRLLSQEMEAGRIDPTRANLELLLQAWTSAREFDLAVGVIDRLAPMTGDGDLFLRKARLLMEENRWQATVEAARQGLALGNVSNPGDAWLLVGIALMELDRLQESRQALQQAQDYDADTRRQAREWQRFVEDRIELAGLRTGR